MGKEHKRDEWLHDIDARQRNVVFPDTVVNEGRFWRNVAEGKRRLTTVQKIGVGLLGLCAITIAFVITFSENYPWSRTFSREKLAATAIEWVIAFAILAAFLLLFRLSQRSSQK